MLTPDLLVQIDGFRRKQLQSLNTLDQAVATVLTALARQQKPSRRG